MAQAIDERLQISLFFLGCECLMMLVTITLPRVKLKIVNITNVFII